MFFLQIVYSSYNLFTVQATEQARGTGSAPLQLSQVSSGGGSVPRAPHNLTKRQKPANNILRIILMLATI
jgi:hypothetical protein